MNKLLKDAIADAKAVRETALANAKIALEEAFAPKFQAMLSHKIAEEADEEMDTMETEVEEYGAENGQDEADAFRMKELAGIGEAEGEEFEEEPTEEMPSEEMPTEEPSEEMPSEDEFSDEGEDFGDESGEDDELAELLRQLEEEEGEEMPSEEEPTEEMPTEEYSEEDEDEEVNLDELIRSLREGDDEEEEKEEPKEKEDMDEAKKMKKKMMETEKELNEAYSAVKYLRTKLNEVNLLNAKLLYVNKLFRRNGLTESQKIKIIETFDRAKTVRETKLIYTTLSEATSAPVKTKVPNKTKVMEGFASTASKKTNIITEGNEQVTRFQKLAGLK